MARSAKFKATTMFEELKARANAPLSVVGLVRPIEENSKAILFAHRHDAEKWVKLPETQVESYEYVSDVRLKDEVLPLVRLVLKSPPTDQRSNALSELFVQHLSSFANALKPATNTNIGFCYWDVELGRVVCK